MRRLAFFYAAFVLAFVLISPLGASQTLPSNMKYELILDCPERRLGLQSVVPQGGGGPVPLPKPHNDLKCPVLAEDEDDIMGSPSIAVDWRNPVNLVLASLHGTDVKGPTDLSRGRQPFTSFFSHDHGGRWNDRPYYPPEMCGLIRGNGFNGSPGQSLGEHPQAAVDYYGHVYIGSLYSTPRSTAPNGFNYTMILQKFESLQRLNSSQGRGQGGVGDYNAQCVHTYSENNVIDQFWFVFDNKTQISTVVWNERVPTPASPLHPEPLPESRSVIGMAWSRPHPDDEWRYYPKQNLTGPCISSTNPVLSEGWIYVGCVVNATSTPYKWKKNPDHGQIDIVRYNVLNQTPEYLGRAPITGGYPKLGVRSDGRISLFSIDVTSTGEIRLVGAFGQANAALKTMTWRPPRQFGHQILNLTPADKPIEAKIQDIMYREISGVVHLVVKLRFQDRGLTIDNPLSFSDARYSKHLIAIDEKYGFLKRLDFDVGNPNNRTQFRGGTEIEKPEAVFNDLSDDLVQLPPGSCKPPCKYKEVALGPDYQREFAAFGDYGIIQFVEVIEITNIRLPGAAPSGVGAPALASPTIALSATGIIVTSVGLAVVGLLALKFALNRSASYNVAITKGGK